MREEKPSANRSKDIEELLGSLHLQHYDYLHDFARYMGCNRVLAENPVQDTFEIVLENPESCWPATTNWPGCWAS